MVVNLNKDQVTVMGPAGALEAVIDTPDATATATATGQALRGTAVIAHPHPLHGGTMDNKVVHTLARACLLQGWRTVRFNFRGVGASAGVYDQGPGEIQDMLAVVAALAPQGPLILAGFSFGAFVASQVLALLPSGRVPEHLVLVGAAVSRFNVAPIAEALHPQTLLLHGEKDETVLLQDLMDWARPQNLPVTVIPNASHFFHGQLPLLRTVVARHISSAVR
jgi:alpha/beta superfamily hydrolase